MLVMPGMWLIRCHGRSFAMRSPMLATSTQYTLHDSISSSVLRSESPTSRQP